MIILALGLVLLLTGSGEAGERICPQYATQSHKDDYRYFSARIYADSEEEAGQCVLHLSLQDKIIYKWERLPVSKELRASVAYHQCHQRMREAMRAMDAAAFNPDGKSLRSYTNKESDLQVFLTTETERLWKKTMADCVKETP
jgi:hypothetical protein